MEGNVTREESGIAVRVRYNIYDNGVRESREGATGGKGEWWAMAVHRLASRKIAQGARTYPRPRRVEEEGRGWMRQKDVQEAFMRHYNGTLSIQNKLLYIIAEFIPTTFDAGSSYAHAKLEEDNMLPEHAIAFSKYIKLPQLRTENQKVAHITIGFNQREDANFAIQNGMFIEGKHVNT